ncbi:hypothetical protein OEIGOIKO_08070 [Streptomyces chrestomyceticus JCM 4735]|uniref:Uncharacterized protein n=1 Tax=Streptomyces chrestomyceticus JCM 4735 TaxID=1306181 RepID=A0A7U9L4H4_9ACTN|nr:hypothetical protein [Streptomyces chrestomyceticus]GCD40213.1 hypothetical protein OEIGOIKO_08070 [Streptomyces chrestomyceticus JCM 4735]
MSHSAAVPEAVISVPEGPATLVDVLAEGRPDAFLPLDSRIRPLPSGPAVRALDRAAARAARRLIDTVTGRVRARGRQRVADHHRQARRPGQASKAGRKPRR